MGGRWPPFACLSAERNVHHCAAAVALFLLTVKKNRVKCGLKGYTGGFRDAERLSQTVLTRGPLERLWMMQDPVLGTVPCVASSRNKASQADL